MVIGFFKLFFFVTSFCQHLQSQISLMERRLGWGATGMVPCWEKMPQLKLYWEEKFTLFCFGRCVLLLIKHLSLLTLSSLLGFLTLRLLEDCLTASDLQFIRNMLSSHLNAKKSWWRWHPLALDCSSGTSARPGWAPEDLEEQFHWNLKSNMFWLN